MANTKVMGIVFANMHDDLLGGMTSDRTMGSVPFASRYRLIDFVLSRMVHAGVDEVGVIMQNNYHSLIDHIGSGKEWDLSRKRGGLTFFPPYSNAGSAGIYRGSLEALSGIQAYLKASSADYVIVSDCNLICGVDFSPVLEAHIANDAGITLICTKDARAASRQRHVVVRSNDEGRLLEASYGGEGDMVFSNMYIIDRELLVQIVNEAASLKQYSFVKTCLIDKGGELPIYCYEYAGFSQHIDNLTSYYDASMRLLDASVRAELFPAERPVYTKVHDEVPVKYGLSAEVSNSLLADGCIIDGRVENCIIFRGVHVGRGAVVRNSILMQGTYVGHGADLDYVICDNNSLVMDNRRLAGYSSYPLYLPKDMHV